MGPGGGRPGPGGPMGNMHEKIEKRSFKEGWGRLLAYAGSHKIWMLIAVICAIAGSSFTILGPDKLGKMTDLITAGMFGSVDLDAVAEVGISLAIFYGSAVIFSYTQGFIMATVTQRISEKLRTEISQKINRLPLKYFDSNDTGDILSRITNDVDTIGQTLNQSVGTMTSAITLLIGTIYMMFKTNSTMAFTAVGSALVGFVFMMIILISSRKYFTRQQKELGAVNGHVEEIYSGHNIVLAYNAQAEANREFVEINNKLYDSAWKSQFLGGLMMPIMNFIGNFGYVCVCIVGAGLVLDGAISFGVVVSFIVYVRLFSSPLSSLAQGANNLQRTSAASYRVFEFLAEEECGDETSKQKMIENVRGDVSFEHVHFGYNEDKVIINDFSCEVKAGQKIAIVGPTGAGKTTIVNLLMRFYETQSGDIKIDGISIYDMSRVELRNLFGMVLQDTWLFEGSIRENILYNDKNNISQETLESVSRAVGLHHYISTLAEGYDTVLGDNASLSGGQRQLVTIARAMVENAPMIILDEATSSVDTRTEILIQEAMDKLMVGRTSFVIAHRLSTIKNADIILVMNKGDIVESGSHSELLEKGGFYADLYNSQFDQSEE